MNVDENASQNNRKNNCTYRVYPKFPNHHGFWGEHAGILHVTKKLRTRARITYSIFYVTKLDIGKAKNK